MSLIKTLPSGWDIVNYNNDEYFKDTIHNILYKNKPTVDLKLPKDWIKLESITKNHPYYFNIITKHSVWYLPKDTCHIKGLLWVGQSCYMDSILVSLFSNPTNVTNYLLHEPVKQLNGEPRCGANHQADIKTRKLIQKELLRISNMIQGNLEKPEYCTNLRKILASCPHFENFHLPKMADSGEFLAYIFGLFDLPKATTVTISYGTDNIIDKYPLDSELVETHRTVDKTASLIIWIHNQSLLEGVRLRTSELLINREDSFPYILEGENQFKITNKNKEIVRTFPRRISYMEYTHAPMLILNINRIERSVGCIRTEVLIDQYINLSDGNQYKVSAIVLYRPGHYVCSVLCDNEWFYYDDTKYKEQGLVPIGSFFNMVLTTDAETTATQIFYIPI
jgi:hypothetical protein